MSFTELEKLSDQDLLKSLGKAVDGEIDQTTLVLRHLILIEERKLHAQNHDSLFAFLTREYRYSANAAQRRIDTARMLREFPSLEAKIQSRAHSLTNLSLARSLFRQEKKRQRPFSRDRKLEVLSAIEGKSTRDAYLYLLTQSTAPELLKKCKSTVRAIGNGYTAFRIVAPEELTADLYRIRDLWAHAVPDGDWTEILKRMTKLTIESIDPLKKAERAKARKERSHARVEPAKSRKKPSRARNEISKAKMEASQDCEDQHGNLRAHVELTKGDHQPAHDCSSTTGNGRADRAQARGLTEIDRETGEVQICFHFNDSFELKDLDKRRPIAAAIRHAVDLRDRAGGCMHLDENGNRCGSQRGLEYDHIIPSALGGPDTVENLRLLCREHNSYYSYRVFGQKAFCWRDAKQERW